MHLCSSSQLQVGIVLANVNVDFDSRNQPVHNPHSGGRLKPYTGEGAGREMVTSSAYLITFNFVIDYIILSVCCDLALEKNMDHLCWAII